MTSFWIKNDVILDKNDIILDKKMTSFWTKNDVILDKNGTIGDISDDVENALWHWHQTLAAAAAGIDDIPSEASEEFILPSTDSFLDMVSWRMVLSNIYITSSLS